MILNTRIWNETVDAAKAAAINSPQWLRAIDRAVIEIEKAKYWAFDGSTLSIISTTSKKLYRVDDKHTCEARNGICKHRASRKLMQRYTEKLASTPAIEPVRCFAAKPASERADLIASITAAWQAKHPGASLADALMSRFRCNRLEFLAIDSLQGIQRALAQ